MWGSCIIRGRFVNAATCIAVFRGMLLMDAVTQTGRSTAMATPRSMIVDEAVTPWYHCTSRCVRRAFLCGDGKEHRKAWIEDRLRELVGIFAVDCAGYAVMDNHLHALLRLDSPRAAAWSAEEVARRWSTLFPLRDIAGKPLPVSEARVAELAADAAWVAERRGRLSNLGWFMKCLKEPLARLANAEDGCPGAFWEGRYKSVAVLDEEALLATAAYIDLNPLAAGVASVPEAGPHTSLHARVEQARAEGTLEAAALEAAGEGVTPPPPSRGDRVGTRARAVAAADGRPERPARRPSGPGGRPDAGRLPAPGRLCRPAGPRRQGPHGPRGGLDPPTPADRRPDLARDRRAAIPCEEAGREPPRQPGAAWVRPRSEHGRRWHRNLFRRIARPAEPAA